jgi:hypothetical protein
MSDLTHLTGEKLLESVFNEPVSDTLLASFTETFERIVRAHIAANEPEMAARYSKVVAIMRDCKNIRAELARLKAAPRYRIECDHVHHGMTAKADPHGGWIRYADVITNEEKAA